VDGDPAGMRALAAQLRAEADRLGALGDSVGAVGPATDFVGPAADRFRDGVGTSGRALQGHAAELQDLAAALAANADEVEAAQAAAAGGGV
jgi:uncharacterized protein YukE